jgi:RNA polymerase-binding transcription factor
MNKTFLQKITDLLLDQKSEILKQAAREINIDTEGDEIDEIQGNMLIEMTNQLNIRNSAKLTQIEAALKRIEDGTYGKCLECDEAIPEKRLLSNPHFQSCVTCVEEREREEKQRKRF